MTSSNQRKQLMRRGAAALTSPKFLDADNTRKTKTLRKLEGGKSWN